MKTFNCSALIILLIFTTSCISFKKAESTKYEKHVKIEKKKLVFDNITESVKIMLADPDYIYLKKNIDLSFDKFPKEIAERKVGIRYIDKKESIMEGTGIIFVKYGLLPGKTLYDVKIVVLEEEIIFSFHNIANLGGNLQFKRDMDIFIEVADKMVDGFISGIK